MREDGAASGAEPASPRPIVDPGWMPARRPDVVLKRDEVRGEDLVIQPERVGRLNATAARILGLCDGTRTVAQICDTLQADFPDAAPEQVSGGVGRFLASARTERWIR